MAVNLAMWNVRAGIPMGGSHAIGHQLGKSKYHYCCLFLLIPKKCCANIQKGPLGVPHGVTSCIMCPAVMKYNIRHGSGIPEIAARQSKVRDILWSEVEVAQTLTSAGLNESSDLGDLLDVIIRALGLPRRLGELQITEDVIPALSRRALDDFWAPTNPVPLLRSEQVREILEAVV
jgi:alcohol dehydrogenase class IV